MSYDLLFYFPKKPRSLPTPRQGAQSSIVVGHCVAIEDEDLHEEILRVATGSRFELMVSCSGGPEDFEDLERIKSKIMRDNAGVIVVDNQAGSVTAGGKVRLLAAPIPETQASLSIFFENGPRFEVDQFDAFMELIQRHLPEALPRRYGPDEPLRFKTAERGPDHFKAQWKSNPRLVWQPHPPLLWVFTNIRNDVREFPKGVASHTAFAREFRCSRIQIIATAQLWHDPKILRRAHDFLASTVALVSAFYAEIRADYSQAKDHAWWWKGLPRDPPLTAIVGEPYLALWAGLDKISRPLGGTHRLISTRIEPTIDSIKIPDELIGPRDKIVVRGDKSFVRPNEDYAPVFPFARPQH